LQEIIKDNGGADEFKYDIFDILRTFANATINIPLLRTTIK
jgi:hypothetical protein